MSDQTYLELIIEEVSDELYMRWYNAIPEAEQTEDKSKALSKNSRETTLFVVQRFMDKFNSYAEQLKSID
jgi:hypothetical protein